MPRRRSSVSADHIEIICQLKLYEVWKRYQCYKKKKKPSIMSYLIYSQRKDTKLNSANALVLKISQVSVLGSKTTIDNK